MSQTTVISRKTSLIFLFVIAAVASRTLLVSFDDPEGPNLLIVLVLSLIVYSVSLLGYRRGTASTVLKNFLTAILIQAFLLISLYFFLTRDIECGSFGCLHAILAPEEVVLAPADDIPKGGINFDSSIGATVRFIATTTQLTRVTSKDFSFNLRPGWHGEEQRNDKNFFYSMSLQHGNDLPGIGFSCPPMNGGWEGVRTLAYQERQFIKDGVSYHIELGRYTADQNEPWYTIILQTTQPDGSTDMICKIDSGVTLELGAQMEEMYKSWQ